jgi:hypothetical protein
MTSFSRIVSLSVLVAFVLTPVFMYAQTDQAMTPPPPVAQPLVREGTLATKLAEVLKVGNPANEAEAESGLTSAGIAPKNGWIADYPVTPDIVGELQNSISYAATAGTLPMEQGAALKAFQDVIAGYNLTVKADTERRSIKETSAPTYPDSTVIYNYYYNEGPPVVTYYAPPYDYWYLYSWVPYPFWWWGFWYPGFFVLADFHFDIHGHRHGHHGWDGHHEFISNHFRDPGTGRISRIDPVNRAFGGTVTGNAGSRWSTPSAQRSAAAIYNNSRSLTTGRSIASPASSFRSREGSIPSGNYGRGSISTVPGGRTVGNRSYYRGQTFSQPAQGSSYIGSRPLSTSSRGSRAYNAPSVSRSLSTPSGGSRAYNAPLVSRGYSGGGSRGSFGGGGFFGGMKR